MFFKPPEVKAISRYSDFGSHLGPRTFGVMLAIAVCIHAMIIISYLMSPHTKVLNIPVRVLNINLGSGVNEPVPASEQPLPQQMRVAPSSIKSESEEPEASKKSPQLALDKALAGGKMEAQSANKITKEKAASDKKAVTAAAKGPTFAMPKKYVRETAQDAALKGKPSDKKEEVAQRYEQVISLWIRQHKIYPQEAKDHHAEGRGVVHVVVNRQGHVISSSMESPTGDAFLDQAALSMVHASDPLPPIPDDYDSEEESFAFNIPLSWELEKTK